jgi:hypothetical protein
MRTLLNTTMLLIFTYTTLAASQIEGYWYNPRLRESIRIVEYRNDIIVKGLFSENRSTRFIKIGRRTYEDREGNLLLCEDKNTILIKRWRARDYMRFDKVDDRRGRSEWYSYHDYDDHCDDHDGWHEDRAHSSYDRDRYKDYEHYRNREKRDVYREGNRYRDNDDKYNRNDKQHNKYNNKDINLSAVIGTWEVKNDRFNSVAIIDTRDGIKAKFSGTSNWISYTRSSRLNEYIDARGNRYIFEEEDKVKWYPIDKDRKVLELKKVSNEVNY